MAGNETPHCCDTRMTPILYGMRGPDLVDGSTWGDVELGGCCVSDDLPMFVCQRRGQTVGRFDDVWDQHIADGP